ncbi:MAG: hypothetical protein WC527_08270 [Candidatus Margulisiibacteriota bacterium]
MNTVSAARLNTHMQGLLAAHPQLGTWEGRAAFCAANREAARPLAAVALSHLIAFSSKSKALVAPYTSDLTHLGLLHSSFDPNTKAAIVEHLNQVYLDKTAPQSLRLDPLALPEEYAAKVLKIIKESPEFSDPSGWVARQPFTLTQTESGDISCTPAHIFDDEVINWRVALSGINCTLGFGSDVLSYFGLSGTVLASAVARALLPCLFDDETVEKFDWIRNPNTVRIIANTDSIIPDDIKSIIPRKEIFPLGIGGAGAITFHGLGERIRLMDSAGLQLDLGHGEESDGFDFSKDGPYDRDETPDMAAARALFAAMCKTGPLVGLKTIDVRGIRVFTPEKTADGDLEASPTGGHIGGPGCHLNVGPRDSWGDPTTELLTSAFRDAKLAGGAQGPTGTNGQADESPKPDPK